MPIDEQEMKVLREKNDQTLEDSHFDNDRGKLIGFHQGADDRKSKNRALLEFEKCNHKTYAEAVCCIKVSLKFRVTSLKKLSLVVFIVE